MYCKQCWYDLRGIDSRTCPECGRGFQPEIPSTYSRYPGNKMPPEAWAVLFLQLFVIALVLMGFFLPGLTEDINSPIESIAVLMVCASMPIQLCTIVYGLCVAAFQHGEVAGKYRFWLLVIALSPLLLTLATIAYAWLA